MKASRIVKRRAPRHVVKVTEKITDAAGNVHTVERTKHVLDEPLKEWARRQVKNNGRYAEACAAWFRNKP